MILLGLVFLYIFTEEQELPTVNQLEGLPEQQVVKLRGTVEKITRLDKVLFLELEAERVEKTAVVLFPEEDIFLREGNDVEITGKVEEYKGKKEIIAHKIVIK